MAGRYTLERELGRGGMATVYLAQDLRHKRPVALKVLARALGEAVGPERFLREIETAARLQHPHILPVHDSGEADGRLWYTMPYVEGETLRERLRAEGQLPVSEVVRLTREIAEALQAAHLQGVIHRDVKPENVLLSHGHALVADFGIARSTRAGTTSLTETGLSLGTPAYMAPEQVLGDRDIDGRADQYALGCLCYELLVGQPPFRGGSAQAVVARHLSEAVPDVRRERPDVPAAVAGAIARAMAKVPVERFGQVRDFAAALEEEGTPAPPAPPSRGRRRAIVAAAVAVLLVLAGTLAWLRRAPTEAPSSATLVAVLPFENRGQPEDDYFAEGLADEVRGKLARIPGLEVVASTSASQYRETTKPVQQIAQELGVRYVLIGSVRWDRPRGSQGRVRVSPELIEVGRGPPRARWQEAFDAPLADVFEVQAGIATQVAAALGAALGHTATAAMAARPTTNLIAYDAYLRGKALMEPGRTLRVASSRALDHFAQATALDSSFAAAWAWRSIAASGLYAYEGEALRPLPHLGAEADMASTRALRLASGLPDAALARATYFRLVRQDMAAARAQLEDGLRGTPNDPALLRSRGLVAWATGHPGASVRDLRRASVLDPRSPTILATLAAVHYNLRQLEEAEDANRRALALDSLNLGQIQLRALLHAARGDVAAARASLTRVPATLDQATLIAFVASYGGYPWLLSEPQQEALLQLRSSAFDGPGLWALTLAGARVQRGERTKARAYADTAITFFREALLEQADRPVTQALYGLALAWVGDSAAAHRVADQVRRLAPLAADSGLNWNENRGAAWIYASIGAKDEAIALLDSLLRYPGALTPGFLGVDRSWDPLRGDPRFQRLLTVR